MAHIKTIFNFSWLHVKSKHRKRYNRSPVLLSTQAAPAIHSVVDTGRRLQCQVGHQSLHTPMSQARSGFRASSSPRHHRRESPSPRDSRLSVAVPFSPGWSSEESPLEVALPLLKSLPNSARGGGGDRSITDARTHTRVHYTSIPHDQTKPATRWPTRPWPP